MTAALSPLPTQPTSVQYRDCGRGSRDEPIDCEKGALAAEAKLLRQLLDLGNETAVVARASAREWSERYWLACGTAAAWEDLYHAAQARRPALGLLLALTATVAAAAGVLVTVAQFASFRP